MLKVCPDCKHYRSPDPSKVCVTKWLFWKKEVERPTDESLGRCELFHRVYDTRGRINILTGEEDGILFDSFPLCSNVRRDETRCGPDARYFEAAND